MDKEFAEAFKKEINTDPLSKIKNILIKEQQAKYDEFPRLVKIWISNALPGVTLKNHMIYTSSFGKVTGCGIILKGEDEVKILISYESNNDVTPSYKSIFDKGNKSSYVDKAGKADPARLGAAGTVAAKIQGGYNVWINKAQSGKESWVLKKDFRDPKKVVQFLKTKVKRMANEVIDLETEIEESQSLQATMALDDEGIKSKWKNGKLYIAKRDVKKAEKALSTSFRKGGEPNLYFEGIDIEKADMKDVIADFKTSDAPQFKGKSDKKKKEMAIAAKLSKEEKEETDDPKSKKKDKINLKPKLDEKKMKKYKDLMDGLREKRAQEGTLKKTVSDYHKEEVKEGVTSQGIEYGEQEFDAKYRTEILYPNLNVNFAKHMDEELEGPYQLGDEVYFYDRKVNMFYSVSGEDYVDEETAKDIAYRLHKDGIYKPDLGR